MLLTLITWLVITLDALAGLAALGVAGVMASICLHSHVASDRRFGVGVFLVGLAIAAHPTPGVLWMLEGHPVYALCWNGVGMLTSAALVWIGLGAAEAAARP